MCKEHKQDEKMKEKNTRKSPITEGQEHQHRNSHKYAAQRTKKDPANRLSLCGFRTPGIEADLEGFQSGETGPYTQELE